MICCLLTNDLTDSNMKRMTKAVALILALLLSGCAGEPQPYEYTQGGNTVTVDPTNKTISNGQEVFTYTIEEGTNSTRYQIFFPDGSEYYWSAGKYWSDWDDGSFFREAW